jgi:hypothetical protein
VALGVLIRRAGALLGLLAASAAGGGCGDPAPPPLTPPPSSSLASAKRGVPEFATDDASWGKFHSKRFQVTIPLPEGRAWKIDDHRAPELVAKHPPTSSSLSLRSTQEEELMNRQRCEVRARALGWVPEDPLTTVEDQVQTGPDAYDSRVWVAIQVARSGGALEGHVFLFGAFLRRCLLVHFATQVPSAQDEEVLASRLALASARILKSLSLDPLRTTDDAALPRDKPDIRR